MNLLKQFKYKNIDVDEDFKNFLDSSFLIYLFEKEYKKMSDVEKLIMYVHYQIQLLKDYLETQNLKIESLELAGDKNCTKKNL